MREERRRDRMNFSGVERRVGGHTNAKSGRPMASRSPHHRSSLIEIWVRLADRLEWISLTATGTRPEPELTEVFLTILFLLDGIIESFLLSLSLGCIEAALGFGLLFPIFAWSR